MERTQMLLKREGFGPRPEVMASFGPFTATGFTYTSGVAGLTVASDTSSVTFLPWMGQQIWRASFGGLDVTMKSIFDEPVDTGVYELSYGNFLMHCGLTAMGNVGEEDDHEPHGELPCAVYDEAYIATGADARGRYMAVGGTCRYRNGLEFNYAFKPEVRLYEGESKIEVAMKAENDRMYAMDYMYMCHVNWRPFDGAHLVYSARHEDITFCPDDLDAPPELRDKVEDFFGRVAKDPAIADLIDPATQTYFPELCCWMPYQADGDGMAHAMQVLPDGRACYVGFTAAQLPYAVRWIARTGDEDACGFCLPCTSNQLGRHWARTHDRMGHIPAKGEMTWHLTVGVLDAAAAKEVEGKIAEALK